MDDWGAEVDEEAVRHQSARSVAGAAQPGQDALATLAERLRRAERPALVAGPEIDACGGWEAAIRLAELQRLPVYATPAPGGGRIGFPEDHPLFQGDPPAGGTARGRNARRPRPGAGGGYLRLSLLPQRPGPAPGRGHLLVAVTSDPDEAARAPMGDAILADPALTLAALADTVGESDREAPAVRPAPEPAPRQATR